MLIAKKYENEQKVCLFLFFLSKNKKGIGNLSPVL